MQKFCATAHATRCVCRSYLDMGASTKKRPRPTGLNAYHVSEPGRMNFMPSAGGRHFKLSRLLILIFILCVCFLSHVQQQQNIMCNLLGWQRFCMLFNVLLQLLTWMCSWLVFDSVPFTMNVMLHYVHGFITPFMPSITFGQFMSEGRLAINIFFFKIVEPVFYLGILTARVLTAPRFYYAMVVFMLDIVIALFDPRFVKRHLLSCTAYLLTFIYDVLVQYQHALSPWVSTDQINYSVRSSTKCLLNIINLGWQVCMFPQRYMFFSIAWVICTFKRLQDRPLEHGPDLHLHAHHLRPTLSSLFFERDRGDTVHIPEPIRRKQTTHGKVAGVQAIILVLVVVIMIFNATLGFPGEGPVSPNSSVPSTSLSNAIADAMLSTTAQLPIATPLPDVALLLQPEFNVLNGPSAEGKQHYVSLLLLTSLCHHITCCHSVCSR